MHHAFPTLKVKYSKNSLLKNQIHCIQILTFHTRIDFFFGRKRDGKEGTVPAFNCCTKCTGRLGIIREGTPDCYPVSRAWMRPLISQLNISLICAWLIISFDMLSMDDCTTSRCQAFGRLVQKLNAFTVGMISANWE